MKEKTVIQHIASLVQARANCAAAGNGEWLNRHDSTLECLSKDYLPRGSGIDCGTKIDLDRSKPGKIVLTFGFHFMDENGFYDGWGESLAVVTPSWEGVEMKIMGKDRNYIKEYLYQEFYYALEKVIPNSYFQGKD